MITNPKYGWCDFKIANFKAHPSYLTDVPADLLDCFIKYYEGSAGACFFDLEEKGSFTFVLSDNNIFIIMSDDKLKHIKNVSIEELTKKLISNISSNIEEWTLWEPDSNEYSEDQYFTRKQNLLEKVVYLEYILSKFTEV